LLIISLFASYYSTQKLISNSQLVNHTNQVLIEAENIISYMKDAETGQRGYLLTRDETFLQPYIGAQEKVNASYDNIRELTSDNAAQQASLDAAKTLYEAKFTQMQRIINMTRRTATFSRDTVARHQEMLRGKKNNG